MATLAELMQALPTELYDEILELTLTTEEVVTIDKHYKPPIQLQIDRASRKAISKAYYANKIFHTLSCAAGDRKNVFVSWLQSINMSHRLQIRTVYIHDPNPRGWISGFVGPIDMFAANIESYSYFDWVIKKEDVDFRKILYARVPREKGSSDMVWQSWEQYVRSL